MAHSAIAVFIFRFSGTWRGDGQTALAFATDATDCTDFLYLACKSVAGFLLRLHEILKNLFFYRRADGWKDYGAGTAKAFRRPG